MTNWKVRYELGKTGNGCTCCKMMLMLQWSYRIYGGLPKKGGLDSLYIEGGGAWQKRGRETLLVLRYVL